jgi:glycosyltransferase involved in cell wall biosynthesis
MPAFRASGTVGRALASVAAQTLRPERAIVVDDGSDDGTAEAAEACRGALDDIELTIVRQGRQGPGAARNRALAEATTEFVGFLDADDEWLPQKLARSMPSLTGPSVVLVCHSIVVVDNARETHADCTRHLRNGADTFAALYKRGFVATSTVVARTEALRAAGGFDAALPSGQDYEFWLRIARRNRGTIVVLPDALTRYHVTAGGISTRVDERRRCALEIARRHAAGLYEHRTAYFRGVASRVAIVSYEAASAHLRQGHWMSAVKAAGAFPAALFDVLKNAGRNTATP